MKENLGIADDGVYTPRRGPQYTNRHFVADVYGRTDWRRFSLDGRHHRRSRLPPSPYFHGPGSARKDGEYTASFVYHKPEGEASTAPKIDIDPVITKVDLHNRCQALRFFYAWSADLNTNGDRAYRTATYILGDSVSKDRMELINCEGEKVSIAMGSLFAALQLREHGIELPRPNNNGGAQKFLQAINNFHVGGESIDLARLEVKLQV